MSFSGETIFIQLIPLLVIALLVYLVVRRGGHRTRFVSNKNTTTADLTGNYGWVQREENMTGTRSTKIMLAIFWVIVFLEIPGGLALALTGLKSVTRIIPVTMLLLIWWMCYLGLKQIREKIDRATEKVPFIFKTEAITGILIALFAGPMILLFFGVQRVFSKLWVALSHSGGTRLRAARIRPAQIDWPSASIIPLYDLRARLQHWLMLVKTKPIQEDEVKKAGEEGERKVLALMDGHRGLKDAHFYAGRRVPKTKSHPLIPSRRSEIDLIILTPKAVHVIEVKNWSGEIRQNEEDPHQWIRRRRNRDAQGIRSVVEVNQAKAWSLGNYLGSKGVAVGPEHIRTHVFFTNTNLQMDRAIEEMPDVVSVHHISGFLAGLGTKTLDRIILRMAKLVLDQESADMVRQGLAGAMPQSIYDQILNEFDQLHTWDRLHFHGGAVETGDLLWVKSHGHSLKSDDLQPGEQIRLQWQRGRILSLLKAVTGKHLGHIITAKQKVAVDMDGQVFFHFAGQPEPAIIPVTSVDIIERG